MRENGFYWIIFEGVRQVAEYEDHLWYLTGESGCYLDGSVDEVISKEPLEYPKTFN
jgi:hypothetical protein